jgi:3-hydroxyisobutyrate dehydrogenase
MRVAVLGLGAMGSRMAHRLLCAGHEVRVYNRSPGPVRELVAAGAHAEETPRATAQKADIVLAMVRDDDASRAIWCDETAGALKGLTAGAIAIESSTLTPGWVRELADQIATTGASFLDAPVVGSRPQADAGQLIHLVGGDAVTFNRARDTLSVLGTAAHHVGPVGTGAALRLIVNALFGIQVAALAELLAVLRSSGGQIAAMTEAIAALPVTSPAAKGALSLMQAKLDAPLFPVDLVEKDFGYVLAQSTAHLPVTATAHACFAKAKAEGLAALNVTAIARLYQTGV